MKEPKLINNFIQNTTEDIWREMVSSIPFQKEYSFQKFAPTSA